MNFEDYLKSLLEEHSAEDIALCSVATKPYSDEDFENAKQQGLDLDDWNDYKKYFCMEEYADDEQDWWRS